MKQQQRSCTQAMYTYKHTDTRKHAHTRSDTKTYRHRHTHRTPRAYSPYFSRICLLTHRLHLPSALSRAALRCSLQIDRPTRFLLCRRLSPLRCRRTSSWRYMFCLWLEGAVAYHKSECNRMALHSDKQINCTPRLPMSCHTQPPY